MRIFAKTVSILFHPLLIVTYGLLFLIWMNPFAFGSVDFRGSWTHYNEIILRIFITTAFLPAFGIFIMKQLEIVSDFSMIDKQERIGPYIATGVFYIWVFLSINSIPQLPDNFKIFVLAATIGLFIGFFINNFQRISIYTVSMGVLIAMGLGNLFSDNTQNVVNAMAVIFIVAGLVGTSRLLLKAADRKDIYGGYLAGIFSYIIAFMVFEAFIS